MRRKHRLAALSELQSIISRINGLSRLTLSPQAEKRLRHNGVTYVTINVTVVTNPKGGQAVLGLNARYVLRRRGIQDLFTVALCSFSSSAVAQLEEIIVTATMRAETLQDVPLSVTVVSDENIESIGAYRMHDLNGIVPNVIIDEGVISNSLSVRGIASFNNQGFEQSVGFFRDGVYIGKAHLSRLPFMDMERVEVLRGPQGTLFGKNTIAGAVSSITRGPTEEFEAGVSTQTALDEDSDVLLEAFASGPLSDRVRGRVVARFRDSDGYLTNIANNRRTEPQREEVAIRGTLEWDISDETLATLKFEHAEWDRVGRSLQIGATTNPLVYQDAVLDDITNVTNSSNLANIEGSPVAFLDDFNGFEGSDRESEYSNSDADIASFRVEGSIGELTFQSNTGYAAYETDEFFDGEFGPLPQITNVPDEDYEQISQEFRFISPTDGTTSWIAGIYLESNEYAFNEQIDVAAPAMIPGPGGMLVPGPNFTKFVTDFDQDEETVAVFGSVSHDFSDALTLTGGIRYSNVEKDAAQSQIVSSIFPVGNTTPLDPTDPANALIFGFWGFVNINPHSQTASRSTNGLEWSLNLERALGASGDNLLYFTVAEGFKSGGFDARATETSPAFEFDDEDARTYELGLKSLFAGGDLQWNLAIFSTEYDDLQQSVFNGALSFVVQNAAEATIAGFETDMTWQISDRLSIWANLGWLDFEYDSYPTGPCTVAQAAAVIPPCFQDLAGRTAPKAPEWNGAFGYRLNRPITGSVEFFSSATVVYSDDYFQDADLDPFTLEESFVKVDAQIGVAAADGRWSVGLLGKNLTDELTCSQRGDTPLNNFTYSCLTNPPRTVYLQADINF